MSNMRFELNKDGVAELMKSPEMMAICKGYADNALGRLGDGYEVSTYTGKTRANASIKAVTREAMKEQYEDNSILKALR